MQSWHINREQIEFLADIAILVEMLVQSASGLDYKICKLKENPKGKNICIDSDFVEFHTGRLALFLVGQSMCPVNEPWEEISCVW